jgi:hypothetical protein
LCICGYKIHSPRVQVLSINHLICVLDTPKSVVEIRPPPPASPGFLLRIIEVNFRVMRCERSGRTLTVYRA